jgi:hypothetical protein
MFLELAIGLTMIALLVLAGIVGWVRSRAKHDDDYTGDTQL